MDDIKRLIDDIRADFHIPPFFPDAGLINYVEEGKAVLEQINPGRSYDQDMVYRMLLKNYVYYAYHNITNEWEKNYSRMILNWQLGSEVK